MPFTVSTLKCGRCFASSIISFTRSKMESGGNRNLPLRTSSPKGSMSTEPNILSRSRLYFFTNSSTIPTTLCAFLWNLKFISTASAKIFSVSSSMSFTEGSNFSSKINPIELTPFIRISRAFLFAVLISLT